MWFKIFIPNVSNVTQMGIFLSKNHDNQNAGELQCTVALSSYFDNDISYCKLVHVPY